MCVGVPRCTVQLSARSQIGGTFHVPCIDPSEVGYEKEGQIHSDDALVLLMLYANYYMFYYYDLKLCTKIQVHAGERRGAICVHLRVCSCGPGAIGLRFEIRLM